MKERIREFGRLIGLDAAQIDAAAHAFDRAPAEALRLADRVRSSGDAAAYVRAVRLDPQAGGAWTLAGALIMAGAAQEEYQALGIEMQVFVHTMSDIRIWADTYRRRTGFDGLGEIRWILHHCRLELFRLGRLQFERGHAPAAPFVPLRQRRLLPVRRGKPCLCVHIPEGEHLTASVCLASMEAALDFFPRYFPEERYAWFCCFSWLLYSGNRALLPPESNIVRFMDLWSPCFDYKNDAQAIERIWGHREKRAEDYSTDTRLRANARRWMEQGHSLGMGLGFRPVKGNGCAEICADKKRTP